MTALNKKSPALVSREATYAFEKLSKAALIDLCADLLRRMHGEGIDDVELLTHLGEAFTPVAAYRGDKVPNFCHERERCIEFSRRYEEQQRAYAEQQKSLVGNAT